MWAVRLGLFLFMRVIRDSHDSRFNRVRDNPKRFFIYWTVQGTCIYNICSHIYMTVVHDKKYLFAQYYVGVVCMSGWSGWVYYFLSHVHVQIKAHVCVYVCVCVRERERERERG